MKIVCRQTRPQTVLYTRAVGPYATGPRDAWQKMWNWIDARNARPRVRVSYGLFRDDPRITSPDLLRYDACVPLVMGLEEEEAAGIRRQILPGGAYAVYTHTGALEDTGQLISKLVRKEVPTRGLNIDEDRPLLAVYLTDPTVTREMHRRTELCVPVYPVPLLLASNDDDAASAAAKVEALAS